MKPQLLEILRCPACRGTLEFADPADPAAAVQTGTLNCTDCASRYPVRDGVPRLLMPDGLVRRSREGFEYQWFRRQRGKAEQDQVIYGYDIPNFMTWLTGTFTSDLAEVPKAAGWLLDAGCGSAEKSRELAIRFPGHQVIAVDQSASVVQSARRDANPENLHFVQANVWFPPFANKSLEFVMSIGVLHHTPDTLRAFHAIAALVAPRGKLLTWIYPLPSEDSFWAGLYRQRDRHFLGLAHRLPKWLTMLWCQAYVAALFPFIINFLKKEYKRNIEIFPESIYPKQQTSRQLYQSSVFLSFDNVHPAHQFRHGRKEVASWYDACGFTEVDTTYPGFFCGRRVGS